MKPESSSLRDALRELGNDAITLGGMIDATSVIIDNLPIEHGVGDVVKARAANSILPMIEAVAAYADALLNKIERLEIEQLEKVAA
jgi:hypothetical protein